MRSRRRSRKKRTRNKSHYFNINPLLIFNSFFKSAPLPSISPQKITPTMCFPNFVNIKGECFKFDDVYEVDLSGQLENRLGEGSFGVVMHAFNKLTKKDVSMKIFKNKSTDSSTSNYNYTSLDTKTNFQTETEALQKIFNLCDSFICIEGFGVLAQGIPFITMNLLKGDNLHTYINTSTLERREKIVVNIAKELIEKLKLLHKFGAHQDIKPENIMINDTGHDVVEVKIIDFGELCTNDYCGLNGTRMYKEKIVDETLNGRKRGDWYALSLTLTEFIVPTLDVDSFQNDPIGYVKNNVKNETLRDILLKILNEISYTNK